MSLLVGTSMKLAGATTWRVYFVDWRSQIAVASLALTAPIPAVLAQEEPALLPLLALAMVAAQSGMSAVSSRTTLAGTDPLTSVANRATLLARLRDQARADPHAGRRRHPAAGRPGQVQGGQRRPRPSGRRSGAGRDRATAGGIDQVLRSGGPVRR